MKLIREINKLFECKTQECISKYIEELAREILLEYQLILGNTYWDITEIEFYLFSDNHPDPFVHKHADYSTGQFRLHGAGIDIAIGNDRGYGGILLRSIRKVGEKELVPSPLKVSDAIIANMGTIESSTISIAPRTTKSSDKIYSTSRIGLNPKNKQITEQQVEFLISPYRYFTADQLNAEKYIKALTFDDAGGLDGATFREYQNSFNLGKSITNPLEIAQGYFNLHSKAKLMGYYSNKK